MGGRGVIFPGSYRFVGLSPDDPIWHPTTFTKNRDRLLNEAVMGKFLEKLMGAPE